MNQREELANEIDSCFVNVELADNTDEKEYWKSIGEITDYFISQIEQAEKRARIEVAQQILDYSDKRLRTHLDNYCKQFYAAFSMANEIIDKNAPQKKAGEVR